MKKVGLVIQGPLMSPGLTGADILKRKEESIFIDYDCRNNIQRIIDDYGHLFDSVVVSTWKKEIVPGESFVGADLVTADDPGASSTYEFSKFFKNNNRYRQFYGILQGVKYLEKNKGVEHIIRIRTDQYLNLERLIVDFEQRVGRIKSKDAALFVPLLQTKKRYHILDFYFGASKQSLKKFCEAMLAFDCAEFALSVHNEIVLKYAYVNYKNEIKVSDQAYFSKSSALISSTEGNKIYDHMLSHVFFSFDTSILETLEWRGKPVLNKWYVWHREMQQRTYRYFSVPRVFATDWVRYYKFKNIILNQSNEPSYLQISLSKLGWKACLYLEKGILAYYKVKTLF
jgi:hypothetical protein